MVMLEVMVQIEETDTHKTEVEEVIRIYEVLVTMQVGVDYLELEVQQQQVELYLVLLLE